MGNAPACLYDKDNPLVGATTHISPHEHQQGHSKNEKAQPDDVSLNLFLFAVLCTLGNLFGHLLFYEKVEYATQDEYD